MNNFNSAAHFTMTQLIPLYRKHAPRLLLLWPVSAQPGQHSLLWDTKPKN